MNACCHRAYSNGLANTPVFVKMFSDRLEIESPGAFPPFVTSDNIYNTHRPRNPHMMNAMYFLEFVRCAHEGTRRIRQTMREMELPDPEFLEHEEYTAAIRVTLRNNFRKRKAWVDSEVAEFVGMTLAQQLSTKEKRIVAFVAENGEISVTDAQHLIQKSWPAAKKLLVGLVDKGILFRKHDPSLIIGPKARYVLNRSDDADPRPPV